MEPEGFLAVVARAIATDSLLSPGDGVLVALSGGPDSLALLHALRLLGYAVNAAHYDHGLRDGSAADAHWVAAHCRAWGIPLVVERAQAPRPDQSEATSRSARYAFLDRAAASAGVQTIAVGHHLDDQAETVVFRLARGSGPAGAAGMPVERPTDGGQRIVRPLLGVRRAQIVTALAEWHIEPLTDPTNAEHVYARNRIRHVVMPALQAVNASAVEHLADFSKIMRENSAAGKERAARLAKFAIHVLAAGLVEVDREVLLALPPAEARGLLSEAFSRLGVTSPRSAAITGCLDVALSGGRKDVGYGVQASTTAKWLVLTGAPALPTPRAFTGLGSQPTRGWGWEVTVQKSDGTSLADNWSHRIDLAGLPPDLVWRGARPDDQFTPWGHGENARLRTFLTRQGIPAHRQETLLVLATGQTVVWVVGIRRAAPKRVSNQATEAVEMQATARFPV